MGSFEVAVAGGGIGGLALAIALQRRGVSCTVYERVDELREVGAGLTLQPNALLALRRLGLEEAVRAAGHELRHGGLSHWKGRRISRVPLESAFEQVGAGAVAIHRGTLHRLLLEAVAPGRVLTGRACTGWRQGAGGVEVRFAGDPPVRAEVLVGADGIHSAVRRGLLGDHPPRYAGYTCWRGVVRRDDWWPAHETTEAWGPGSRVGLVPVDGGRLYWFAVLTAPPGGEDPPEGPHELLSEHFGGYYDPIPALLQATPAGAILRNDIIDRPPVDTWGEGRVTLLGDAAHAMTPNMGQGACQAIEDAVVLGHLLDPADPEASLRRYEARRQSRTRWFVDTSWRLGAVAQWQSAPLRLVRDVAMSLVPPFLTRRSLRQAWSFTL